MPRRVAIAVAASLAYCLWCWFAASAKPFSFDELVSLQVDTRVPPRSLIGALEAGADSVPPLYHLVNRVCLAAFGEGPIAVRPPAVLGFGIAALLLYTFLRKRLDPWAAALGPVILFTGWAEQYAYEARPYGAVLACAAAALVAWQRGRYVILAVSLALATCFHYYAVLCAVPLIVAEIREPSHDRRLYAALTAGVWPLALHWPLVAAAGRYAGWPGTEPTLGAMARSHAELAGLAGFLLPALAFSRNGLRTAERWAGLGFLLLPVCGYLIASLHSGVFATRYVIPTALGMSLLGAQAAANRSPRTILLLMVALFAWWGTGKSRSWPQRPEPVLAETAAVAHGLVVIDDPMEYVRFRYYADDDLGGRMTYCLAANPSVPEQGLRNLVRWAPAPLSAPGSCGVKGERFHILMREGAHPRSPVDTARHRFETRRSFFGHWLFELNPVE